ncbi:MAG: homocysteine S-methyltransferase family protein [Gracilibacteraceae bacterium]|jgi:5-methyltetrahydrofolate--homocysteine methyltransferase|nr:homocysteine S-methyltransferase family protein [Gracilibacteraceae bacterium]
MDKRNQRGLGDGRPAFQELLARGYVILDGAMGTVLQREGIRPDETPELLNITAPERIGAIHREYAAAGAQVLYANTFGANACKLKGVLATGADVQATAAEIVTAAVRLAREAAAGRALVALDIGPLGELLEPLGVMSFEAAYEIFKAQVLAGAAAGADLAVVETMTDLGEMRAAVLAVRENSDLPIIATMSFETDGRTFTGCSPAVAALTLTGLGVSALGLNCSLGPGEAAAIVSEFARWTHLPLVVKPNAGLPDPGGGGYSLAPAEFAAQLSRLTAAGAQVLGGCCGTTPEAIRALRAALADRPFTPRPVPAPPPAVCSATRVVSLDGIRVIGERINPTGKKLLKEALLSHDTDFILKEALQQCRDGADILDVNVGMPGIDEKETMKRVVKALQSVTDAPLQIDSADPAVIEAGLRLCHGKAVINSVNGDETALARILPVARRYGAAVVGLTLDERGIPNTAAERLAIARRILARALEYGLPARDVYIDCLTLTVSAEPAGAEETLRALTGVREELGLKTLLGVSNISFGLPERPLLNRTFLAMALGRGLDLPIMNPGDRAMMDTVYAARALRRGDPDAAAYIARFKAAALPSPPPSATEYASVAETLRGAVTRGLKDDAGRAAAALAQSEEAMDIIDAVLIPALDEVGVTFDAGRVFLPQLIASAQAAQSAFAVLSEHLKKTGAAAPVKGAVVLATVYGDIHDIGKNIAKVLLENYGYKVGDLGRNAPPAEIVAAARDSGARLVGLSALMTTTLPSMAETIRQLRAAELNCQVMVGGAVLTPEYAREIGADFYARDAKAGVDIARRVFAGPDAAARA